MRVSVPRGEPASTIRCRARVGVLRVGPYGLIASLWPTEAIQAVTPCMRMTLVVEFACLLDTPGYPARIHPITAHCHTSSGEPCIDHMPGDGALPRPHPKAAMRLKMGPNGMGATDRIDDQYLYRAFAHSHGHRVPA